MLIYTPEKIIFDGSLTTLTDILSCALAKMGKSRNDFKFSASVGRFPSDGAASTAVKGLMLEILPPGYKDVTYTPLLMMDNDLSV